MATKHTIPAVGYARRSTDLQERSIPDQQAFVERWASEHGYRILRWYVDDAISGTSARGRDAFERMMEAAEAGRDFDCILCYDMSRFSRGGTNETGYYLHRLKLAGVDVLFPADAIPEGDEGELIQGVKSWQARQYSVKLARDSIRGQISNIRVRRSAPGGVAPYGYDKQHRAVDGTLLRTLRWLPDGSKQEFGPDGKLLRVIEPGVAIKKAKSDIIRFVPSTPERVAVVRRIYELCVQGYGFHSIAQLLNGEGIASPTGQKWNTSRLAKLIRNPVYRGAICWNKHTMGSLFGLDGNGVLRPKKQKGWHANAESDWILSENVHEPLVSPETWHAAQRAVAKRRADAGKARPTKRTLLANLLVCKRCGHSFTTIRDRRWPGPTGEGYRYYTCSGYHRYGKGVCRLVNLPGPALDAFVLATIKRVLLAEHQSIEQAIERFVKAVLAPKRRPKPSRDAERELEAVNRKIKAVVAMLADPAFDGLDELRSTLSELKARRDALQARLKPADVAPEPAMSEAELRAWAMEQFARLDELATRTSADLKDRQLVAAFVERIEIDPETKTGVVFIAADLEQAFRSRSTRVPIGDFLGCFELAFYGWKEGAGHRFFGPNNVPDLWQVKKVSPQKMLHLCLHPESLVLTEAGYRPIRSLQTGDRVFSGDGTFHDVVHVSSHPYTSEYLYRITAKGGNITTEASDNHPFLIWRPARCGRSIVGGEVGWVRADEVQAGDYTMTPVLAGDGPDPFPELDEDFWFLFGLYLAQGHLQAAGHGDHRYPVFSIHKRRQDLAARICKQWPRASEYDPNDYAQRPSSGLVVMAFDADAGERFEALGGRHAHAKRMAPEVFSLPRAKRSAILHGWLNGDGCKVHDRPYWQGNTVSADLAAQLALLAESVGYRANVYAYDPPPDLGGVGDRRFQSRRRVYYLYFYEQTQLAKRGCPTWVEHGGQEYSLRRVKSVERVPYGGQVWNLSIEGHPSFQTAVGLSHNTEKPVELAVRAIQYSSLAGENVLDLFGGSGSTLIAAEQTGRRAFLMELDPLYCDTIVQRFENFTGKKAERKRLEAAV